MQKMLLRISFWLIPMELACGWSRAVEPAPTPPASAIAISELPHPTEKAIPYSVPSKTWPVELGRHRALVRVEHPAEAVWVHLPWRRRDRDPERKNIVVVDETTGKSVTNLVRARIDRESGDIVFQPSTVPGEYGVYYLPGTHVGATYFPNFVYDAPAQTSDPTWRNRCKLTPAGLVANRAWQRLPRASVIAFQARTEFDRFDPMEVIATADEVQSLHAGNSDRAFWLFPEDRRFPIRMTDDLPSRWVAAGLGGDFRGEARPGEFYTFQVGVYAVRQPVNNLRVVFGNLRSAAGGEIPASAMRCFNLGGVDWLGRPFVKTVNVPKDKVQALWFGVQVPPTAPAGTYTGRLCISGDGLPAVNLDLALLVAGELLADAGDSDLWRMSRLRWLDSTVGLEDEVVAPYKPVAVKDGTVSVLGREVTLADTGLPAAIASTFSDTVDKADDAPREILARPMRFALETASGTVEWLGGKPRIVEQHSKSVTWESQSNGGPFQMRCRAKMECDGYINYEIGIKASEATQLRDARLEIPLRRDVAKYMMGLGRKGGWRPAEWQWKWDINLNNHRVWLGDVNAGLHCRLKNPEDTWELYSMKACGLPESWYNGGRGGCTIAEKGEDVVLVQFYSGPRGIEPNQELLFRFGLLTTPVKTLNPAHWNWREFYNLSPVEEVVASGANIISGDNRFQNYPFDGPDYMKSYIDKARQHGIKVKLYYTIRELTTHAAEFWALRSFGDEVLRQGPGFRLSDQFVSQSADKGDNTTGHAWLQEHLVTDYVPGWVHPYPEGASIEVDPSIATRGLSRWHNYYIESVGWLIKDWGMGGVYLDGIGYDRETMKRLRAVMDRTRPGCIIDCHSGNHFSTTYGLNSILNQYIEHLPYIDSLWLGEGFDYNETPEYWLIEISGIPFGLYGEMIGAANAWRGMVYGMSNRLPVGGGNVRVLWKVWDEFGIQDARMLGYWNKSCPVKTDRNDILATAYVKPGKTLIALASWAKEKEDVPVSLRIKWQTLGIDRQKAVLRAPSIPGVQEARIFQPDDKIPVPHGRGWLLVLEEK